MGFTLYVGDYAYSSWSLRGWLVLDAFAIPFTHAYAHLKTPAFDAMRAEISPAQTVPALALSEGAGSRVVVWESLAIAETVHEHRNQAGIWPKGERARPLARALAAEMHAGFRALRMACPMNMRRTYAGFRPDPEVRADLDRLSQLWTLGRARRTSEGPYLFGAFSGVDAFFAPVASRIATYGLEMGAENMDYVAALLAHPSVRRWRAMAMADNVIQPQYEMDLPPRPDPYAPEVTGTATLGRAPENACCPFTGADPVYPVEIGGRILGFGDAFTAAKVAADPLAWPEVVELLERRPA